MADPERSLEEIEEFLSTTPAITSGEPQRIMRELARHMIRQQKEIDSVRGPTQPVQARALSREEIEAGIKLKQASQTS